MTPPEAMTSLFILKKIIGHLLMPVSIVMIFILLGILWRKRGKWLVLAALVLLYLFSLKPVADLLLAPLERPYGIITAENLDREISWVVVLGGGSHDHPGRTPEDRLSYAGLKRLQEGLRLGRLLPGARLLLSGGNLPGYTPEAIRMREVVLAQGFDPKRVVVETASLDTDDQARLLSPKLAGEKFYLVTSASHMTRAKGLFLRQGASPIPAPTDFRARAAPRRPWDFLPKAVALFDSERAFHEYLGLAWGRLRGRI